MSNATTFGVSAGATSAVAKSRSKSKTKKKKQKVHQLGIESLGNLMKLSTDEVIKHFKNNALFSKLVYQIQTKVRLMNVIIQVVGGKLCAPASDSLLMAQKDLIATATNVLFLDSIQSYLNGVISPWLNQLQRTSNPNLLIANAPYCPPQVVLEHLSHYFKFVDNNLQEFCPNNFDKCVATFHHFRDNLKKSIANIRACKIDSSKANVLSSSPRHRSNSCVGQTSNPLGIEELSVLLNDAPHEVIPFIHSRRDHLSHVISAAIPDHHLNLLVQILGLKLCQNVSLSAYVAGLQMELVMIFTSPVFLKRLLTYENGLAQHQSLVWNFGSAVKAPYAPAMDTIACLYNYYSFLILNWDAPQLPFSQLLQNIKGARRVLHEVQVKGLVKLFSNQNCPAFQNIQLNFKKLDEHYNDFLNNNKSIPRNHAPSLTMTMTIAGVPAKLSNPNLYASSVNFNRATVADNFVIENLLQMTEDASDQVITSLYDHRDSLFKVVSKKEIAERHLNLLIQIIGGKVCRTTSFVESQKSLISIFNQDTFFTTLYHYTRKLLQNIQSNQEDSPPYCSAPSILKHLFTFYNFTLIHLKGTPGKKYFVANIESAYALLRNVSKSKKLSDKVFTALKCLAELFENLKNAAKPKSTEKIDPSYTNFLSSLPGLEIDSVASQLNNLHLSKAPQAQKNSDPGKEIQDCFPAWNLNTGISSEYSSDYNFIQMHDVPTKGEVSAEVGPTLNPMPMKGNHSSSLVYLKDQYRLLREDFVCPLRQFLNTMLWKERKVYMGRKNTSGFGKTVRFYHGVRFHEIDSEPGSESFPEGIQKERKCCTLRFSYPKLTETEWEDNDWLLPESLILVSADNFKTIYVATVAYKSGSRLEKGLLTVMWEGAQPPVLQGVTFLLAESEAYFVSYRYTLKALQIMAEPVPPDYDKPLFDTYPMAKYIVNMSTDQVPPPKYLRQTEELLNFSALTTDNADYAVDPLELSSWPNSNEISLDAAQFSAFQSAVTQELSIIQGPPGTGKTYIGLQLMKLFLSNPQIFQSPILVVCRTNHALDQFLEGVLPIMENLKISLKECLLRVGGGSESELLENYIVRQKRIKKDLKLCDKSAGAAMPSVKRTSNELKSLRQEARDLECVLEQVRRAASIAEVAKLAGHPNITDFFQPNSHVSSPSNFLTEVEEQLLEQISVVNVNIGIALDQEKFRGAPETKENNPGKVIGMTTTGAAKHTSWVRFMRPKIVIVEEAAEVLESHIVTSITEHCEHLILIGDHKQLRPLTQVHKLATNYHLDISLFERLIKNNLSWSCLETQHRMRPEICKLLVPTIYEKLDNHSDVMNYPDVAGFMKNLFFINHREHEQVDANSTSKMNRYEALYLVALCRHVVLQDYDPSRVTVLITYNGQKQLVEQMMEALGEPFSSVKVKTVDSYQGEENDVIILSLVRSNPKNNIGFLSIENRICVALSRARHGFYIIGNMDSLVKSKSKMWAQISAELKRQQSIGDQLELKCQIHKSNFHIRTPEEFKTKSPEGGCSNKCDGVLPNCEHRCQKYCHIVDKDHAHYQCQIIQKFKLKCGHSKKVACFKATNGQLEEQEESCESNCGAQLDCGHPCVEKCHGGSDPDHDHYGCKKKCMRRCELGHPCATYHLCFQDCQPCKYLVDKRLPCDHMAKDVECFQDISFLKSSCKSVCNKTLPNCSHRCSKLCHSDDSQHQKYKCTTLVDVQLNCGHIKRHQCYQTLNDQLKNMPCDSKCGTKLECGHVCVGKCHKLSDPSHKSYECEKQCMRKCEHAHNCQTKHLCFEPCKPCLVEVNVSLSCGHHEKEIACWLTSYPSYYHTCEPKPKPKPILCAAPLPHCNHRCPEYDHHDLDHLHYKCQKLIRTKLNCGHIKEGPCYERLLVLSPCDSKCGEELSCGHICSAKCHSMTDPLQHSCKKICMAECIRSHVCGQYHCSLEDCPPCMQNYTALLNCQQETHVSLKQAKCYESEHDDLDSHPCMSFCNKVLDCGHKCVRQCHSDKEKNCKCDRANNCRKEGCSLS